MNKLLIVLLAICLISYAHAFVKRETTDDKGANDLLKQLEELSKSIGDKISKSIDGDAIMKNLHEGIDKIKTGLDSLKDKTAEAPK